MDCGGIMVQVELGDQDFRHLTSRYRFINPESERSCIESWGAVGVRLYYFWSIYQIC